MRMQVFFKRFHAILSASCHVNFIEKIGDEAAGIGVHGALASNPWGRAAASAFREMVPAGAGGFWDKSGKSFWLWLCARCVDSAGLLLHAHPAFPKAMGAAAHDGPG
jgi:hypothetical protein